MTMKTKVFGYGTLTCPGDQPPCPKPSCMPYLNAASVWGMVGVGAWGVVTRTGPGDHHAPNRAACPKHIGMLGHDGCWGMGSCYPNMPWRPPCLKPSCMPYLNAASVWGMVGVGAWGAVTLTCPGDHHAPNRAACLKHIDMLGHGELLP